MRSIEHILSHVTRVAFTLSLVVFFVGCRSTSMLVRKRVDFLLSQRIDTVRIDARHLAINDSNVYRCLDTLIVTTRQLPEFDNRLVPIFWIRFRQEKQKTVVDFEASNSYESLDMEALIGKEDAKLFGAFNRIYEAVSYRGYNFIVDVRAFSASDSIQLPAAKEAFFKDAGSKLQIETYRFYSQRLKRNLESPHWYNRITFLISGKQLEFLERKYHPIDKPLLR